MDRLLCALGLAMLGVACDIPQGARFVPLTPTPVTLPAPPSAGGDVSLGIGADIALGQVVQSRVEPTDAVCFPNWDAGGQCRQFNLTVWQQGSLDVTLKWTALSRGYDMTLFLITPEGGWLAAPEGAGENRLNLRISPGVTYRFIVMSYTPPQNFELTTTLR